MSGNEPDTSERDRSAAPLRIETVVLDETGRVALPMAPLAEPEVSGRHGIRPGAVALVGAATVIGGLLVLESVDVVLRLFERGPLLGWGAAAVLGAGFAAIAYWLASELRGLARLRSVERIRAILAAPSEARAGDIDRAIEQLLAGLRANPAVDVGLARYRDAAAGVNSARRKVALVAEHVLKPLDAAASAAIYRASALAFGANFLSPTALIDAVVFVWRSAALVRAIAEIYGLRPGALGTAHLARRIVANAGMVGAADAAGRFAANVVGTLFARLSTDLAASTLAAQRIARVGRLAQLACRPVPMAAGERAEDLAPP
jgi:putative membrane protein